MEKKLHVENIIIYYYLNLYFWSHFFYIRACVLHACSRALEKIYIYKFFSYLLFLT